MPKGGKKIIVNNKNALLRSKKTTLTPGKIVFGGIDDFCKLQVEKTIFFRKSLTSDEKRLADRFDAIIHNATIKIKEVDSCLNGQKSQKLIEADKLIKSIELNISTMKNLFKCDKSKANDFERISKLSDQHQMLIGFFIIKILIQLEFYYVVTNMNVGRLVLNSILEGADLFIKSLLGLDIIYPDQVINQLPKQDIIVVSKLLGEIYEILSNFFYSMEAIYKKNNLDVVNKISQHEQQIWLKLRTLLFTKYTLRFSSKYLSEDGLLKMQERGRKGSQELTKLIDDSILEFSKLLGGETAINPKKLYLVSDISVINRTKPPEEDALVLTNKGKCFLLVRAG